MIWGRDKNSVDILAELVEHLAIVGKGLDFLGVDILGLGPFLELHVALLIDVNSADELLIHVCVQVGETAAAAANLDEANFVPGILGV